MKYSVTMTVYDNWKSRICPPQVCPDNLRSWNIETANYTIYIDVFDSREAAEEFYQADKDC